MGTKIFCSCSTAGWELVTPSTSHLGPPGAVEQHPDPRLASRLRAFFRLSADSGPVVAWSSEQRTPSLCDCYSFGRSCYARCFLFPGLSAPVVTDAFAIIVL